MTDRSKGTPQDPTVLLARGYPWRTGSTRTSITPEALARDLAQAGPAALAQVSGHFAVASRNAQDRRWVRKLPLKGDSLKMKASASPGAIEGCPDRLAVP